jgi:hypothetical protein
MSYISAVALFLMYFFHFQLAAMAIGHSHFYSICLAELCLLSGCIFMGLFFSLCDKRRMW